MDDRCRYNLIKEAVIYDFEDYINDEQLNSCQTSGKIIEEEWRRVNYNNFTKNSYFLNIAIESFRCGEIADFVFEKIDKLELDEDFEEFEREDYELYKQDLDKCKKMENEANYKIIETSRDAKLRVEYVLMQKSPWN